MSIQPLARTFLTAFFFCLAAVIEGSTTRPLYSINCSVFLSGLSEARQENLFRPWLEEASFEENQARARRRTHILLRAYDSLLSSLAASVPEFRDTKLFVYPASGPDVLFQRFAPVFAINRDLGDFEIGQLLLETASIPFTSVTSSPSRLFQDPAVLTELQNDPRQPKTLLLKHFDLFTAGMPPAEKEAQLQRYLTEVQNVLILNAEDRDRWLSAVLRAGFEPIADTKPAEGLTLGVSASCAGRHKSILIPDEVVFLKRAPKH